MTGNWQPADKSSGRKHGEGRTRQGAEKEEKEHYSSKGERMLRYMKGAMPEPSINDLAKDSEREEGWPEPSLEEKKNDKNGGGKKI